MSDSKPQLIAVTAEQIARAARGEIVEIVPARGGHVIEVSVNESNLLTAEYVPARGEKHKPPPVL